jgi:hypothetical protein
MMILRMKMKMMMMMISYEWWDDCRRRSPTEERGWVMVMIQVLEQPLINLKSVSIQ